jgi:RsiW-degrading membrane proteinase PrsW (M82 family)
LSYLVLKISLAVIPALILLIFFYNKDKQKKEPVALVVKVFIFGFLSVLPAILIEMLISHFIPERHQLLNIIIRAFIIAALVEEWIKLKTVMLFAFPNNKFDEVTDGIVYTITASLGFAVFENIFYSFGPVSTLIIRGLTAVPLHAIASGIMGYYIGKSKFEDLGSIGEQVRTHSRAVSEMNDQATALRPGANLKYKGLIIAVLIHGFYDFFLFYGSWLPVLIIPLLLFSGVFLFKLYKSALHIDRAFGRS